MLRFLLKLSNGIISMIVVLALLLSGAYAGYCLWDNQQIYTAAENVQAELLRLKPKPVDPQDESGPTFDELLAINKDVCAWISMDGTKIDYPVLQGESNLDYINRNIYKKFALAGSIFLDSRNDRGFGDPYSVLYGHHMEKSAMFGDLDKYLDGKFFEENTTGELIVPGKSYSLKVISCIQTRASEDRIFDPSTWRYNIKGLIDFAEKESINLRADTLKLIKDQLAHGKKVKILALTTCSSDFTDARTIVLTLMSEIRTPESGEIES